MCVTSSPPWTPRSMAGSRTCCSSPRGSTRWPAIRSAASRSRPTTSRHGPPPCVNASPRRRLCACSRVATGWPCSPPASAPTRARLPDGKAAPMLPPMALRLAIEEGGLPTRHRLVSARGATTGYRRVWVRVIDEEGLEGWGEADPSSYYGENYDSVRATIERLAPHLPRDPFDLEGAEACFRGVAPTHTAAARAALSAALHDLWGKRLGQPLWRLSGVDPPEGPRAPLPRR